MAGGKVVEAEETRAGHRKTKGKKKRNWTDDDYLVCGTDVAHEADTK